MRQVTIYTSDNDYEDFLKLAKNLSYVKKIVTDDNELSPLNSFVLPQELKDNLDKALEQDKKTFLSREEVSMRYGL